mgnify:CR=1 FL=1
MGGGWRLTAGGSAQSEPRVLPGCVPQRSGATVRCSMHSMHSTARRSAHLRLAAALRPHHLQCLAAPQRRQDVQRLHTWSREEQDVERSAQQAGWRPSGTAQYVQRRTAGGLQACPVASSRAEQHQGRGLLGMPRDSTPAALHTTLLTRTKVMSAF